MSDTRCACGPVLVVAAVPLNSSHRRARQCARTRVIALRVCALHMHLCTCTRACCACACACACACVCARACACASACACACAHACACGCSCVCVRVPVCVGVSVCVRGVWWRLVVVRASPLPRWHRQCNFCFAIVCVNISVQARNPDKCISLSKGCKHFCLDHVH